VRSVRLAAIGVWVFAAGIFAWIFPNLGLGATANVLTDSLIAVGAGVAAFGLPRAVDGIGNGPWRCGLLAVALAQFGQNLVTLVANLTPTDATPVLVVMLASVALVIGIRRWQADGWDRDATPWLAIGFAGYAFEPVYYLVLGAVQGTFLGPFFIGSVLVAIGAGLAGWAFRPGAPA
jgi:hypothetical protein